MLFVKRKTNAFANCSSRAKLGQFHRVVNSSENFMLSIRL